jgi:hypothetical protein
MACYLGKAKNQNASFIGTKEPFSHKFCRSGKKLSNNIAGLYIACADIAIKRAGVF